MRRFFVLRVSPSLSTGCCVLFVSGGQGLRKTRVAALPRAEGQSAGAAGGQRAAARRTAGRPAGGRGRSSMKLPTHQPWCFFLVVSFIRVHDWLMREHGTTHLFYLSLSLRCAHIFLSCAYVVRRSVSVALEQLRSMAIMYACVWDGLFAAATVRSLGRRYMDDCVLQKYELCVFSVGVFAGGLSLRSPHSTYTAAAAPACFMCQQTSCWEYAGYVAMSQRECPLRVQIGPGKTKNANKINRPTLWD